MKKLWFIVFLLFSIQQWVVAQYSPACFTISKSDFCVNEPVELDESCYIKLDENHIDPFYYFDIENFPTSVTENPYYVYQTPGTYKIIQWAGIKPDGSGTDTASTIITVHGPTIPDFTIQTCEGRKVIVQILTQSTQPFEIFFGDGNLATTIGSNPVTHTYSDNTTKQISIKGMCTSMSDPKNITPLDILYPAAITRVIKDENTSEAIIEFNGFANHKYKIYQQINGGSFDSIGSVNNQAGLISFTQKPLNPNDQYCYFVSAFDACSAKNSDTICTISATASAGNNVNTINWNPLSSNVNNYSLTINGVSTIPDGPTSHSDENVNCGRKYFYNITAHQNNSQGQPLENTIRLKPVTGVSTTTPTAVQNLNATISGSSAKLSWESPSNFTVASYKIFRSVSQSPFTQISTSLSNTFTDPKLSFSKDYYCYKVIYEDSCGNVSLESDITCPIILRVNKEKSEGGNEEINLAFWNRYQGSTSPSEFILEKLDERNNVIETMSLSDTSYLDSNIDPTTMLIRYRVKVPYSTGEFYYSNIFEVRNEIKLFAPDIFTPNGDNQNDVFFVYGKYFKDFELSIFNRWGEMVFHSKDIQEGWDGTFLGQPVPVDDYTFVINANDNKNNLTVKKGMVTLMR